MNINLKFVFYTHNNIFLCYLVYYFRSVNKFIEYSLFRHKKNEYQNYIHKRLISWKFKILKTLKNSIFQGLFSNIFFLRK